MENNKTRFTITMENDLLKRIDDYRFNNRMPNRTAAVIKLMEMSLDALEQETKESMNNACCLQCPLIHMKKTIEKQSIT